VFAMGFSSKPNCQRVSDGAIISLLDGLRIHKTFAAIRAIGIGDRFVSQLIGDEEVIHANTTGISSQREV